MTPNFVPIVGSGFDQVAGQGQFWAGFNQRQDSENLARLQTADLAQNQWFSRLSEMQSQENQRRDAADLGAAEVARRARADQLNSANYGQQIEQAAKENAARLKLDQQRQTWVESKDATDLKRQGAVQADYAEHLQPQLSNAYQEMKNAEAEQEKAIISITSKAVRAQKLPHFPQAEKVRLTGGQYSVGINPITKNYYELSPAELSAITQANDMLAADNAAWLLADRKLKTHSVAYEGYHSQAVKSGMLPEIHGNTVLLRVPELARTFGKMVEDAKDDAASKAAATDAAAADYEGVSVPRSGGSAQFIPQTATAPAAPFTPQPVTGTTPPPAASRPFVGLRSMGTPLSALPYIPPAPTPVTAPAPFIPGQNTATQPPPPPPAKRVASEAQKFPTAPDQAQREDGKVYQIPSGPLAGRAMRWSKISGWLQYDPKDEAVKKWLSKAVKSGAGKVAYAGKMIFDTTGLPPENR